MAPLAIVNNLVTRWHRLHRLHRQSSLGLHKVSTKGVVVTGRPNDRTPCAHGSDKKYSYRSVYIHIYLPVAMLVEINSKPQDLFKNVRNPPFVVCCSFGQLLPFGYVFLYIYFKVGVTTKIMDDILKLEAMYRLLG